MRRPKWRCGEYQNEGTIKKKCITIFYVKNQNIVVSHFYQCVDPYGSIVTPLHKMLNNNNIKINQIKLIEKKL